MRQHSQLEAPGWQPSRMILPWGTLKFHKAHFPVCQGGLWRLWKTQLAGEATVIFPSFLSTKPWSRSGIRQPWAMSCWLTPASLSSLGFGAPPPGRLPGLSAPLFGTWDPSSKKGGSKPSHVPGSLRAKFSFSSPNSLPRQTGQTFPAPCDRLRHWGPERTGDYMESQCSSLQKTGPRLCLWQLATIAMEIIILAEVSLAFAKKGSKSFICVNSFNLHNNLMK